MRKILVFFAVILAVALAACGAAGSSASPVHKATLTGVFTGPSAPAGWKVTYARNFATTPGLGDWVVQPGAGATIRDSTHPGAEFGVGVELTAVNQWAELISKDAVIGPNSFVQALVFIPQSTGTDGLGRTYPTPVTANWPAWWTAGNPWPENGEIDALEGLAGHSSFHGFYGPSPAGKISTPNFNATPNSIGTDWITITFLRQNDRVTAWYGTHELGSFSFPTNADETLRFQDQSYSTSVCSSCFGPTLTGPASTAWLSRVAVYAPA
jgi:hypothetical protein